MAAFRNLIISVPVGFHRMETRLWKSGDHIPNSVAGLASALLMLYLIENRHLICFLEARLLESNLLGIGSGSLNGGA